MTNRLPERSLARETTTPDDDRKFVVGEIDSIFLDENNAISYLLSTNWIETGVGTETKVARKEYEDGTTQILHIAKKTDDGHRTSQKQPITEASYQTLIHPDMPCTIKRRYEFSFVQSGVSFQAKYDEFVDNRLWILEIDAQTAEKRVSFDPRLFPFQLTEVTGDKNYEGFRVTELT